MEIQTHKWPISLFVAVSGLCSWSLQAEEGMANFYGDFRLRLETVRQDNAAEDATALTLRSRLGYASESYNGLSAVVELENNIALIDDYNDKLGQGSAYSVVADPEYSEVDQAYLKYSKQQWQFTLGRQVITYDNHRYVGHVGWRQDRQTYDAVSAQFAASDALTLKAAYIDKRNGIFGQEKDLHSNDALLNVSYKSQHGQLAAYAYWLELEDNGVDDHLNTVGLRYSGQVAWRGWPISYVFELAHQRNDDGAVARETQYSLATLGTTLKDVNITLGYENLGSVDGQVGFATPLATLHKFNGWADMFLTTPAVGLVDQYIQLGGALFGGHWVAIYHEFSADEASASVDNLGSELDVLYKRKIAKGLLAGVKYAQYDAQDYAVDTDRLWVWASYAF